MSFSDFISDLTEAASDLMLDGEAVGLREPGAESFASCPAWVRPAVRSLEQDIAGGGTLGGLGAMTDVVFRVRKSEALTALGREIALRDEVYSGGRTLAVVRIEDHADTWLVTARHAQALTRNMSGGRRA